MVHVVGILKKSFKEDHKDSTHYMRNGKETNFSSHAPETDDPSGKEKDSANVLHTTVCECQLICTDVVLLTINAAVSSSSEA